MINMLKKAIRRHKMKRITQMIIDTTASLDIFIASIEDDKKKQAACPATHCSKLTIKGKPCKGYVHKDGLCFMHFWSKEKSEKFQ